MEELEKIHVFISCRELPEEQEDLPEQLEKPQLPDLQSGKSIPKPREKLNEESRERRE